MPKVHAYLAAIQALVVSLGWVSLGIVMKMAGYPGHADATIHWNPAAVVLREYGLLFMAVPVLGYFLPARPTGEPAPARTVIGVILAAALLVAFLYAAACPYTRMFLLPLKPTAGAN